MADDDCIAYSNTVEIFFAQQDNRILFVSCSHMNCCLQNYTTHQFTYFIHYLFQDKFKYPKKLLKSNNYIRRYMQNNFYYFI